MSRLASMERAMRLRSRIAATLVFAGLVATHAANGAGFTPPTDGWASWQVPAVAGAPDWCCFDWLGDRTRSAKCKLDDKRGQSYGSLDSDGSVDSMRLYARFEGGELRRIRALGPGCPVETRDGITDLGSVAADDSARWLIAQTKADEDVASDVLAALATHAGTVARDGLVKIARSDEHRENRKSAVFWIGQLRASDSADALKSVMFEDADPELREHAAFSLSQSVVPDRDDALIRLGRTDRAPDVRAKAWFWLAQTGAPESETAIAEALATESDEDVREQAIFALSQLPDERAVDALTTIVEDSRRSRDERKRALFWLGQNESPRAQAYLAEVLSGR